MQIFTEKGEDGDPIVMNLKMGQNTNEEGKEQIKY